MPKREEIVVQGLASGRTVFRHSPNDDELKMTLMDFLVSHGLPIASSCGGEGVCGKCVVSGNLLSCQVNLLSFIGSSEKKIPDDAPGHFITIDYL